MGSTMSIEEMEAMRINAMLHGQDVEFMCDIDNIDEERDYYDASEFTAKELKKRKTSEKQSGKQSGKSRTKKKEGRAATDITDTGMLSASVKTYPQYEKLYTFPMTVSLLQHSIHYKEQDWGIPSREVEYRVELVTNAGENKIIAEKFNGKNSKQAEMAYDGKVRYFKIICAADSIPSRIRQIGFIQVYRGYESEQFKVTKLINVEACKNCNVEMRSLEKRIGAAISTIKGMK